MPHSAATFGVAGELPPDPPDVSLRDQRAHDQLVGIHIEPTTADVQLNLFWFREVGYFYPSTRTGNFKATGAIRSARSIRSRSYWRAWN